MSVWTIGDVCQYVEHPTRRVRVTKGHSENTPFNKINRFGKELNRFSSEYQNELISNWIELLEQLDGDK